jgi:hypothetical protein
MRPSEYKYDQMQNEINSLQRQILNMEIAEEKRKSEEIVFLIFAFLVGTCIGIALTMVLNNA